MTLAVHEVFTDLLFKFYDNSEVESDTVKREFNCRSTIHLQTVYQFPTLSRRNGKHQQQCKPMHVGKQL